MTVDTFVQRRLLAHAQQRQWCREPRPVARRVFADLLDQAGPTAFGRDHKLGRVRTFADFASAVPVRGYEPLRATWTGSARANPRCSP